MRENNVRGKRVIVTGGAGVIGKELISRLQKEGATIRCFDLLPRPIEFSAHIQYFQKDLSFLNQLEFSGFEPDMVFHLAATFERTKEDPDFWDLNYQNEIVQSHAVIDAAKNCKSLRRFVFASSYLIYDPALYLGRRAARAATPLREDMRINPRNLCGAAKLYTEKELEYLGNFPKLYPFQSVFPRIFRVYGRGSRDIVSRWVRAALRGEPIEVYHEENIFDYIFAGDAAEGLIRLAASNAVGAVNLGTGHSRRVQEVVSLLKKKFSSLKIKRVSLVDPFESSVADISSLKHMTGWQPKMRLEEGISELIRYERTFAKKI